MCDDPLKLIRKSKEIVFNTVCIRKFSSKENNCNKKKIKPSHLNHICFLIKSSFLELKRSVVPVQEGLRFHQMKKKKLTLIKILYYILIIINISVVTVFPLIKVFSTTMKNYDSEY